MNQAMGGDGRPWPWSTEDIPVLVRELVGRRIRIAKVGDAVTQEYQPGRVTIYVNEQHRIGHIQIEPGRDTD